MKVGRVTIYLIVAALLIFVLGDVLEDRFQIPLWLKSIVWLSILAIGIALDTPVKSSLNDAVRLLLAGIKNYKYSVDMQAVVKTESVPTPLAVEKAVIDAFARHRITIKTNDIQVSHNSIIFPVSAPYFSLQVKFDPDGYDEDDHESGTFIVKSLDTQIIDFRNRSSPLVSQWINIIFDTADELGRAFGNSVAPQMSITLNRVRDRHVQAIPRPPVNPEFRNEDGVVVRKDRIALQLFSSNKNRILHEIGNDISDLELA